MIVIQYALLLLLCGINCLKPMCCALYPKKQTEGVPETFAVESFRHEGIFPLQVSLHSNLDKRENHDSQQLELFPTKQHPRFSSLKDKSNKFIKEEKMTSKDDRQLIFIQERTPDLKMLKRSKRTLEEEIENLTDNYRIEKVKQCCRDGYKHVMAHWNCYSILEGMEKVQRTNCYKAFKECCLYSQNHFTKVHFTRGQHSFCVSMPKFWKVSEPQKVGLSKLIRPYHKTYLVQISLLSYPDRNVTYDSQALLWNLADGTREVAMNLLFKLEDVPNRDELDQFVYLVTTVDGDVNEQKVPLLDLRVTLQDLKKPKGSIKELESEIETLASKYHSRKVKKTCRDAYKHYIEEFECQSRLQEFEEEGMLGLYRVFQKCCLHTREYMHRMANTEPDVYNINYEC